MSKFSRALLKFVFWISGPFCAGLPPDEEEYINKTEKAVPGFDPNKPKIF